GIAQQSDDLDVAARLRSIETEAFADRVLHREEAAGEALADDGHLGRSFRVRQSEIATQQEPDSHGSEEIWPDRIVIDASRRLFLGTLRPHARFRTRDELPVARQGGRLRPWNRIHSLEQLMVQTH